MSSLPHRLGITLASFGVFLHAVWVILVAFDWAKPLMDRLYSLHFLVTDKTTLLDFNLSAAVGLLIVVLVVWYAAGYILGMLWNAYEK